MTITIEKDKAIFVYASIREAREAQARLRTQGLDAMLCSRGGGYFNALEVDLAKAQTQGGVQ